VSSDEGKLPATRRVVEGGLILGQVVIGNTSNKRVINDMYFFKLDLSKIIPSSVSNANFINSIAESIGLHDFYQVGLWNFCEGYNYEYVCVTRR